MSERLAFLENENYEALGGVQKVEIAKLFIINRPEDGFETIGAIEEALEIAIIKYGELLGAVNDALNVEEMQTALEEIANFFEEVEITEFMAEAVLSERPIAGYTSVSEIIVALQGLEEELKEAQFIYDVNVINGEGNMSERLAFLENENYEALGGVQKVEIAKLFIINRPEDGFETIGAIEEALEIAIIKYGELLGAVNDALNVEEMQTALEEIANFFEEVTITDFIAAFTFYEKPENGYASVSQIIELLSPLVESGEASVSTFETLELVLTAESIITINITADITADITASEPVVINHELTLNGNNHTLHFTGLEDVEQLENDGITIYEEVTINKLTVDAGLTDPSTWEGIYAIQVYQTTATLNDVTVTGGNAGLYVNGSTVTVENITTSGNGFGGIEVSQGQNVDLEAKLIVTGESKHALNENVYIWTIGEQATVVDEENQYKSGADIRNGKTGFVNYILSSESRPVPYTEEAAFKFEATNDVGSGNELNPIWGNFAYSKDGAFYILQLRNGDDDLVPFAEVFETFKLQTVAAGSVEQINGNWHDYTNGLRNRADFTGEAVGGNTGTKFLSDEDETLRNTDLNGTLFYGIHSSILGVNIAEGDVRTVLFDTKIKAGAESGDYELTIALYAPVRKDGGETKYTLEELESLLVEGEPIAEKSC